MIPCLVLVSVFLLMVGGLIAAKLTGILTMDQYVTGIRSSFVPHYVNVLMVKGYIFSFIITSMSAFQGYYTKGGALEVGRASTNAVTNSCIAVLFLNFTSKRIKEVISDKFIVIDRK